MGKFNVLIQAYQHLKIHWETCCITMIFLTANDACGKLSTSRDPIRAASIRLEFELIIYEFAWPIYEIKHWNSDFRAVWNAALLSCCYHENHLRFVMGRHIRVQFRKRSLVSCKRLLNYSRPIDASLLPARGYITMSTFRNSRLDVDR